MRAAFWDCHGLGNPSLPEFREMEMFGGTVVVVRLQFGGEQFEARATARARALTNLEVRSTARERESLRIRLMDEIWLKCTPQTRRRVVVIGEPPWFWRRLQLQRMEP